MLLDAVNWNAVEAVGTSVGATMTGFALITAVVAVRREARRRRADVQRLDDARLDAEAAQARLVVARYERELGAGKVAVTLVNYSALPISSVSIRPNLLDAPVALDDGRKHPAKFVEVLEPGETAATTFTVQHGREHEVYAEFIFNDARGLRWRRVGGREPVRHIERGG